MTRRSIISLLLLLALMSGMPAFAGQSQDAKKLKRIEREMREKKRKLKRAKRTERSILSELERIDRESAAGHRVLADQKKKLGDAEEALAEIVQKSDALERDAARLQPLFAARLRAIYKTKRSGGYALAILSADDAASFSRRVRALAAVAEQDNRLLARYRSALERLEESRSEAAARRAEIRESAEAVAAKGRLLREQRRKKTTLLASVQRRKSVYEETLEDLEESSQQLWARVKEAERARKKAAPSSVRGAGRLPWPLRGPVLMRFGNQRHPRFGTVVFRNGIDIRARTGDPVHAVAAGDVLFADWVKGFGQLVVINHGSGLFTLYGHLSSFEVNPNDRVGSGQVIGKAGETGSLEGPRLYFELRRNGKAEDPLRWLAKQ